MKYEKNFYQIKSNNLIYERIVEEQKSQGYFNLPDSDIDRIQDFARKIKQKNIFLLAIGGSALGAKAIYNFISSVKTLEKDLLFLDTIDPQKILKCIASVDLNDSFYIVVSKSGTTIEPLSIYEYISSITDINTSNCCFVTSKNNPLFDYAQEKKFPLFDLAENISGRFSAFSVAGLLPLAAVGIDIQDLLYGCKIVKNSFFEKSGYFDEIFSKARFLIENKSRFNINVIFSYGSALLGFNNWYMQLWAESLGKININGTRQALTPITLIGPGDQHSFLQLIIDGVRDKTITFIKIADHKNKTKVLGSENSTNSIFDIVPKGISFNELINLLADSTIESINSQKDIPYDVITIDTVDECNIAKLMYSYQILVSVIGAFLQINTYNQPGVEMGKVILKEKLNEYS